MVKILKYKKIIIDHDIYIKFFSDGTVSYLTISTDDVINTTYNKTEFPELRRAFKKLSRLKSKKDMSLSTNISKFSSILLVSVLIIMIKKWN